MGCTQKDQRSKTAAVLRAVVNPRSRGWAERSGRSSSRRTKQVKKIVASGGDSISGQGAWTLAALSGESVGDFEQRVRQACAWSSAGEAGLEGRPLRRRRNRRRAMSSHHWGRCVQRRRDVRVAQMLIQSCFLTSRILLAHFCAKAPFLQFDLIAVFLPRKK